MIKTSLGYSLGLIRFGSHNYLKEFRETGKMYMNTLTYFRNLEDDDERSDISEGLSYSRHAEGEMVTIGSDDFTIRGQVKMNDSNSCNYKIFSLYGQNEKNLNRINNRMLEFGDSAVIITEPSSFLDRFIRAAEQLKIEYSFQPVEYVSKEEYCGHMGPYRKYSDLKYQSEFRIVMKLEHSKPLKDFYIGDIRDITKIYPSDHVIKNLKIQFNKQQTEPSGI
jgi:hypothetical protein|tara:strand:- start:50 stop:715 length:666 start_codon:yes stop_codon:yes gene_type:complete